MFKYNTQGDYIIKKSSQDKPIESFGGGLAAALVLAATCKPTKEIANECENDCECKSGKCKWWNKNDIKKYNEGRQKKDQISIVNHGKKCS
jgi:hypothetical protein